MYPNAEIKKQVNPFYCNVCKIWCASALNLQTDFLGFKHKAVEEALKAHGIVYGSGEQVKIPDYGLNYIIEYRSKENSPFSTNVNCATVKQD